LAIDDVLIPASVNILLMARSLKTSAVSARPTAIWVFNSMLPGLNKKFPSA
jgi:hypothetical protein